MKNIILATLAMLSFQVGSLNAQEKTSKTTQTANIRVEGSCNMCKKRIEEAAYIQGVKRAEWNKDSKELKVVYNSKKTSIANIEQNVAKAGHDAGEVKATKEQYEKLPACCAYGEVGDH